MVELHNCETTCFYYLRSTVKHDRLFRVCLLFKRDSFVSTEPMKMFRLEHETMRACQTNVARFVHVVCRFVEIEDIF